MTILFMLLFIGYFESWYNCYSPKIIMAPLLFSQHAILKPFMLRRVKIDVIAEMTKKKEEIVPCKLSPRQQIFYQAIKNKISLNELLDGSRGNLNDKKLLSLMNIVMQLRKVVYRYSTFLAFDHM
jgi:SNF2 family DNA or RNA helicase